MFLVNLKRKRDENELAIHGVSVSEMEETKAIYNRLKVKYDVENNLIRCIE